MGHLVGSKSHLVPLIDRLNRYPVGLVDNLQLRHILSLLFSEQEAYIASCFPLMEATVDELAERTAIEESELLPHLEQMADKGLVVDMPCGNTVYWLLMPGLIGFFEFTFMKQRTDLPMAELAQLMREYLRETRPGQAEEFFGSTTQLTRALVYEDQVPLQSQITSYEDACQIVREAGFGAAGLCFCRHQREHLGEQCERGAPVEGICIALGEGARFMARRGFMAAKTTEELLAILATARQYHLTHVTDNIREQPSFICNCCACCCELMAGVQSGFSDGVAKTPFIAQLDAATCNGCGRCVNLCNAGCIEQEQPRQAVTIDLQVCLGCGACIPACSRQALQLIERRKRPTPPRTKGQLFGRMLWEKGRLMPFVASELKRRVQRCFRR